MDVALESKLQGFSLIAQEKLEAIICSIPGRKDLIIESSLIKPLDYICAASWLKLKGIQRIYKFSRNNAINRSAADCVQVYMLRSNIITLYKVLQQIRKLCTEQLSNWPIDYNFKHFHIIWLPSCFAYFQHILELEGLYGMIEFHQFNWNFIYLDKGVLSCEITNVFATVFAKGDYSLIPSIMHSLRILCALCGGKPDLVLTYGEHSENIMKMLQILPNLSKNADDNDDDDGDGVGVGVGDGGGGGGGDGGGRTDSYIDVMLIVDRDKDYVSSLLTPIIYAGLLLEIFPFNAGILDLNNKDNKNVQQQLSVFLLNRHMNDNAITRDSTKKVNKTSRMYLNSVHDEVYAENCYKPFVNASANIRAQTKNISLETRKLDMMKVDEMHDYVSRKLPQMTNLKEKLWHHLNACEQLIDTIGPTFRQRQLLEEHILNNDVTRRQLLNDIDVLLATDGQRCNTLRLLCLFHICIGLTDGELIQFIKNYCNYFGFQHLLAFHYLANAGLLPQIANTELSFNQKATKLLSNIPLNISKFQQQTPFQMIANRLKLLKAANDDNAETNEYHNSNNSNNSNSIEQTSTSSSASSLASSGNSANYVFSGLYTPLVAQLCTLLLKSTNTDEFLAKLPTNESIKFNNLPIKSYLQALKQNEVDEIFPLRKRRLFIYMVGSVTYAEIAACQLIGKQYDAEIYITSDAIFSGSDLISSVF